MRLKLKTAAIGLAVTATLFGGLAPSARADISPTDGTPFPTNGEREVIENVGSDTSYFVVCDLAQRYSKNKPAGVNPGTASTRDHTQCLAGNAQTSTVPPSGTPDCSFSGRNGFVANPSITVRSDADDDASGHSYCAAGFSGRPCAVPYVTGSNFEPSNGSSEGITDLGNCNEAGPLDFARSSRGPGSSAAEDDMQFYAYAMGGLTWTRWSDACVDTVDAVDDGQPGCAPRTLTGAQLRSIYACDVTDWSQVGGDNAPIIRYAVQAGSGTRSSFENRILGGGISMSSGIALSCPATDAAHTLQEHDASGVIAGERSQAIYAYDTARWKSQSTGFELPDNRNGALLGRINNVAPSSSTLSEAEASETETTACASNAPDQFCGSRYIYNVIDTPNAPGNEAYQATINFVGVRVVAGNDNDHNGMVCSNAGKAVISANGFTPLKLIEGGAQTRIDEPSSCRLITKPALTNAIIEAANA